MLSKECRYWDRNSSRHLAPKPKALQLTIEIEARRVARSLEIIFNSSFYSREKMLEFSRQAIVISISHGNMVPHSEA
jgi:hypothetical protein